MKSTLQDFVAYVDDTLLSENKDVNAVNHAAQMFLEFQKKIKLDDSNFVSLASSILNEIGEESISSFYVGLQLGLILGKYSKKIDITNVRL